MNTPAGGRKAAATNKQKWGKDFFKIIGASGGRTSRGGGFSDGEAGRARARIAGAKGGTLGRRKPRRPTPKEVPCTYCTQVGHIAYECPKRQEAIRRRV